MGSGRLSAPATVFGMALLVSSGGVHGNGNSSFLDDFATRAQVAAFLERGLEGQ